MAQLEGARANLQTILDNLTAGVIVFDRNGAHRHRQPGRDAHPARCRCRPIAAAASTRCRAWRTSRRRSAALRAARRPAPRPASATTGRTRSSCRPAAPTAASATSITLLVRGAAMPQGARLLVFDDITELVSAQRVEAWSEVARRLAHEIKNPLTPIQLSAERLQHEARRQARGRRPGACSSARSTTIVDQVQAMKRWSTSSATTRACRRRDLKPLDLNALVAEVLGLYGAAQEPGRAARRARRRRCRRSSATRTQLRQVIHNLVQNALDAVAEQARRPRARRAPRRRATSSGDVARGAPASSSTTAPASPTRSSSAPSSPTSRPRPRAPASAWRWSRRSPTSTARACASPTSATPRGEAGEPRRAARKSRYHFRNSRRRPAPPRPQRRRRRRSRRTEGFMATILVVDDELGIRALLSEILDDEGHTVELAENAAAGARLPRAHPARPGAARHLDARRRRHHAAEGVGRGRRC